MREFYNILSEFSMFSVGGAPYTCQSTKHEKYNIENYKTEKGEFATIALQKYMTFDEELQAEIGSAVAKSVKALLRKKKISHKELVLVVGVGNEELTVDALGATVLKHLKVTEHLFRAGTPEPNAGRLATLKSGVSGVTGINSFDIVKSLTERLQPACVVAIDTLSCRHVERLGRIIQVTDMGILPGSGVGNAKTLLGEETLGVPVISVGVPLVIYAENIIAGFIADGTLNADASSVRKIAKVLAGMLITLKDVELMVESFARVIGNGINMAVHGSAVELHD